MASITDIERVLHNVQVKLYPNYLPKTEGAYIARTDNNKVLSIEDICAILKTRAGFNGKYEELLDCVRQYLDEVAYQLCDGHAVNNGYYCVYPNIGGTFNSVHESIDNLKHPVTFRFSMRSKLRSLIKNINVVVEGFADTSGYIDEFIDFDENSVNTIFIPGDQFAILGNKIKIAGDDPSVGVYFVPVEDPSKAVKVTRMAQNTGSKIIGIAPNTEYLHNRIEIRTQYSGSGINNLKVPRVITSKFILEAA